MKIALVVLLMISSLGLTTFILLQSGRSAGLSGSIAGAGEAFFGKKKGMDELFSKVSIVFSVIFLLSALGLAFFQ